ncbi:MAG: RnfABCDGE type electron transport complex subunit G [Anaerofustis sp.]
MRDIVKLAVILLIISAIAAGALAYTNQVTAPQIASSKETAATEARTVVMPKATDFTLMADDQLASVAEGAGLTTDELNQIYAAYQDGTLIGYTFKTTSKGYSGDIIALTGINLDGTLGGVTVLTQTETAGLGAKSQTDWIDQYQGKSISSELTVIKLGTPNDSQIQAITGATITSRAVTKAVNMARSAFLELQGGN